MKAGRTALAILVYAISVLGIFISLALGLFSFLARANGDSHGGALLGLMALILFGASIGCFFAAGGQVRRSRRN
jgi:hypothetical protein